MDIKVLVIEDDMEIVESIILSFKVIWPEAEVVFANHGVQGISKVQSESPDIIILDLGLPDISGYEVLKQIRPFLPYRLSFLRSGRMKKTSSRHWKMKPMITW
jgi:DNA-binding response OmpR family regulator